MPLARGIRAPPTAVALALGRLECQARHDTDPLTSDPHTDAADDERALNDRRAAILEAVVTEYIGTAEPVGSSHVANAPGVQVSSATVRSEMVALEREGYLVQPHTSAGRIPTDKGYRFFVDHLTGPGVLGPDPAPPGDAVLRPGPRRDGDGARAGLRPALRADLLRRRRRRPLARHGHHPLRPAGRPVAAARAVWSWCSPTAPSRSGPSTSRPRPPTRRWPAPARCSPPHLVGRTLTEPWTVPASGSAQVDHLVGRGASAPSTPWRAPWSPTRCSWAARPAWPSPSTPSRRCARCSPSSSSSWSS